MATDRIPLIFYKGNFKEYKGNFKRSAFLHLKLLKPFISSLMALACIPEILVHLLTPILPYIKMTNVHWHIRHTCQKCQKCLVWRICHPTHVIYRYGNMGIKRGVRTSGMQTNAIRYLLNKLNGSKCQNTNFLIFSLYFLKFPLYFQNLISE